MQSVIVRHEGGADGRIGRALGRDLKGRLSPVAYLTAMALAFVAPLVSNVIYAGVAAAWLIPDRRLEGLAATNDAATQEER